MAGGFDVAVASSSGTGCADQGGKPVPRSMQAQIRRKTLDISALSAERLSEALWTVHGSDHYHPRARRNLRPPRQTSRHYGRYRVLAGDDLLPLALCGANGEPGG